MLSVLEAHFQEMNETVENSEQATRNQPQPAGLSNRHFFRIHADWSIDTDGDGSPDWAEFEMAANASHPFHSLANPFVADVDNNQVPDGNQLDLDSDQTADALDIAADDPVVTQPIGPTPRYALFPIPATAVDEMVQPPLQINDRGSVLYENGVWNAGQAAQKLTLSNQPKLKDCKARGINDSGEVIGFGSYQIKTEGDRRGNALVYWPNAAGNPSVVKNDSFFAVPDESMESPGASGSYIANDGSVVSRAAKIENTNFVQEGVSLWTLPGIGGDAGRTAGIGGVMLWAGSSSLYWGYNESTSKGKVMGPGNPGEINFVPRNVVLSGGVLNAFSDYSAPRVFQGGGWQLSQSMPQGIDISSDGTVISLRKPGLKEVLRVNGRWITGGRAAPVGQPAVLWSDDPSLSLLDTTKNGWILAQKGSSGPTAEHAVMLPIKIEGHLSIPSATPGLPNIIVSEAAGVDDFSVTSPNPGSSVDDRLWVMAPAGEGETELNITAPLDPSCQLELSGEGVLFDGNPTRTIGATRNTVVKVKAASGTASGSEILLDLKLGNGAVKSVSAPVGAKVMKRRIVKVAMYPVAEDGQIDNPPDLLPTEAELERELNRVFTPQLNVVIDVVTYPQLLVDWDKEPIDDHELDVGEVDQHSSEQALILNATLSAGPPPPADIKLFLIGSKKPIGHNLAGWTNREAKTCWVLADSYGSLYQARDYDTVEQVVETITHEIGHVIVGYGHPDESPFFGPAPLRETLHSKRLMVSGPGAGPIRGKLLVKGEWDAAEEWLNLKIKDTP